MQDALNKQINEELGSSYIYLAMQAFFDKLGLEVFSKWMQTQVQEEIFHATNFYQHIVQRGGDVELFEIKKPEGNWQTVLDAFNDALKHEQHITKCINDLVDLAESEKDHATRSFLQWFVDEQVEEEDNVGGVVDKLKMAKDNSNSLLMLDKELAQRQPLFTMPQNE